MIVPPLEDVVGSEREFVGSEIGPTPTIAAVAIGFGVAIDDDVAEAQTHFFVLLEEFALSLLRLPDA